MDRTRLNTGTFTVYQTKSARCRAACTSIMPDVTQGCLESSSGGEVLRCFGAYVLGTGTSLYHFNHSSDDNDDVYMERSGSGYFSFDVRTTCWRYKTLKDIVLPVTSALKEDGCRVDVLPEFVSAIMPSTYSLDPEHFGSARGNTHVHLASGARFQATAYTRYAWGERVRDIHARMKQLGFAGWIGCDNIGRDEVVLFCPIDRNVLAFDGLEEHCVSM